MLSAGSKEVGLVVSQTELTVRPGVQSRHFHLGHSEES